MESIGYLRVYPEIESDLDDETLDIIIEMLHGIVSESQVIASLGGDGPLFEVRSLRQPDIIPFVESWIPFRARLESYGIKIKSVNMAYNYFRQCSLGFNLSELTILVDHSLHLVLDCWIQKEDENI